jgi:hypothetical protein
VWKDPEILNGFGELSGIADLERSGYEVKASQEDSEQQVKNSSPTQA